MPLAKIHVVKGRFDCSPNTVDFRARPQLRSGREALRHAPTHDLTPRRQSRTVSTPNKEDAMAEEMRRLPAYVLSAPAVLSEMRVAQGLDREIQRQGQAVQLRHSPPPYARLRAAVRHCRRRVGRGTAHDAAPPTAGLLR